MDQRKRIRELNQIRGSFRPFIQARALRAGQRNRKCPQRSGRPAAGAERNAWPSGIVPRPWPAGKIPAAIMTRALLIFFFAAMVAPPADALELKRILYGTTASPSPLPIWVAKDAGYFEKFGLNVEPVQIRGGSLITK